MALLKIKIFVRNEFIVFFILLVDTLRNSTKYLHKAYVGL